MCTIAGKGCDSLQVSISQISVGSRGAEIIFYLLLFVGALWVLNHWLCNWRCLLLDILSLDVVDTVPLDQRFTAFHLECTLSSEVSFRSTASQAADIQALVSPHKPHETRTDLSLLRSSTRTVVFRTHGVICHQFLEGGFRLQFVRWCSSQTTSDRH